MYGKFPRWSQRSIRTDSCECVDITDLEERDAMWSHTIAENDLGPILLLNQNNSLYSGSIPSLTIKIQHTISQ